MSRIIIDGVQPFQWMDTFPKPNEMAPGLAADVRAKWKDLHPVLKTKKT